MELEIRGVHLLCEVIQVGLDVSRLHHVAR